MTHEDALKNDMEVKDMQTIACFDEFHRLSDDDIEAILSKYSLSIGLSATMGEEMGLHDLKDRFDNIEIIEVSSKLALNPLNEDTIDLELIKRNGIDKNKTKRHQAIVDHARSLRDNDKDQNILVSLKEIKECDKLGKMMKKAGLDAKLYTGTSGDSVN